MIACSVAFELRVRDGECDTIISINGAALQVPPQELERIRRRVEETGTALTLLSTLLLVKEQA